MNDNKLIAEFMGTEYTGTRVKDYDTSWDWLMPVAEKCLTTDEPRDRQHYLINDALLTCNIEEVYKAVVEFIKQWADI